VLARKVRGVVATPKGGKRYRMPPHKLRSQRR
jgi:hypothetical protein